MQAQSAQASLSFLARTYRSDRLRSGSPCGFRREARNDVAEVVFVELSVMVDLAGEEAFPQWTE